MTVATRNGEALSVIADGIPAELRADPRWILWRLEKRDGDKPTKVPYQTNGKEAKSNDPSTWTTFEKALARYKRGGYSGIGRVFVPGAGEVGIDLDDCRDPLTEKIEPWAQEVIDAANTYAEISPSGTGVKLWGRGKLPTPKTGAKRTYRTGAVEMYQKGRYFAVTGHKLPGVPDTINDCQALIDRLSAEIFAPRSRPVTKPAPSSNGRRDSTTSVVDRARAYVGTMPPAVSGQGGHNQTFAVACKLVQGFDLDVDQAWTILRDYNDRCEPPWSEFELRHKLDDAVADDQGAPRGYLRDAERAAGRGDRRHQANGKGKLAASEPHDPPSVKYQRLTCAELDANEYTTEFLVDKLLVAGQPCIVAGGKKTLKTSVLIDLGLSLATCRDFLAHFRVMRTAKVALMTGESGLATIQETARRIAPKGLELADVTGLIISPDLPRFGDAQHMDALREFLTADEIEIVAVDPAYLAIPTDGNESSLFAMGGLLRGMVETCNSVGTMLVLAHHTKKSITDPYAPPELEHIAWSGFPEFARQWLLLGRREPYEPGRGDHRLWLNVGGSAGHSGCYALDVTEGVYDARIPRRWELAVMHASEARNDATARIDAAKRAKQQAKDEAQIEADQKSIVAAMVKINAPDTETKIRDKAKVRNPRFGFAWESLVEDGTIEPAGKVTKGNNRSYPAYQLRQEEDTE